MEKALNRVTHDLFDLAERPLEETRDGARFLVHYEVVSTGVTYTRDADRGKLVSEQTIYIGIELRFTFTLQVPKGGAPLSDDPQQGYRFEVKARPPSEFSFRKHDDPQQEALNVYGSMAWTAFNQFADRLAEGYGFGKPKK